ncbi:hypothetical protein HA42_09930 [Pantoea deleyi]|nr:hypothetical protein HA42_09930 [Pantoea deleyi]
MLIVTAIGVFFSTLAAFFTARAAVATRNSTKVSEAALLHTQHTSRRDEFISQYTILLEQHKEQLNVVKSYLSTVEGLKLLNGIIMGTDHLSAFKKLQGHNIVSPYMRVLYHLLRHIDFHYDENATTKDKKLYSSTVRSLIRNDVLLLVAVNASYVFEDNKENDYGKYQKLLRKFNFFEHAHFFIEKDVTSGFDKYAVSRVKHSILEAMINNHEEKILFDKNSFRFRSESFRIPFIVSCIFDNPLNLESLECLNNIGNLYKDEADQASERNINFLRGEANIESFFHLYLYRRRIRLSGGELLKLEDSRNIDADTYSKLPFVDEDYIKNCLSYMRANNHLNVSDDYYIHTQGENHFVDIIYPDYFSTDCKRFLKLEKHLEYIVSRDADREHIRNEQLKLSDFRSAVLRQRVTT